MTLGEVNLKTLFDTHADTSSYPDATMLININIYAQKFASIVFESQDDSYFDDQRNTTYPIATSPFVLNGTDNLYSNRDISVPVSEGLLKERRVDVTYDGTNYFRATPFDGGVPMFGMSDPTNAAGLLAEDANFIQQAPRYSFKYNSFFMYPRATAANISAGAKIRSEWERTVIPFSQSADYNGAAMSTSTTIPGFDLPFHPYLVAGAKYEFGTANNLPQVAIWKNDVDDWEARIRIAYSRKDLDTMLAMRPAYDSYGDYGATGAGGAFYGR